jgi:F-type H+-transporting ATPase subunit a
MVSRSLRSLLVLVFSVLLAASPKFGYSQPTGNEDHGSTNEKLDPAKVIMEHIQDDHEWHFFSIGDFHASIPLPVILYSKEKGLSIFSSSKFGHHREKEYNGYKMVHGKIVSTDPNEKVYDFSLSKNVVQMFLALLILVWIMTTVAKRYKKGIGVTSAPKGIQNLVEPVITFVRDEVAKPNLGHKWEKYLPYLLTVFFFILINNLFGLIPGSANVTGNIAFTVVLGVISFIVIMFSTTKHFWGHIFWPHVPHFVKVILIPVELIGVFTKPFALIIRLFANMVAGHIIILSFISLIFIFGEMSKGIGWGVAPVSILFSVFIYLIEILVAFIQAFIFTNLTAVFIGQAFEGSHDDVDKHTDPAII